MGSSPAKRATFPSLPTKGGLAQMVRASVLHTEGQRFESSIAHHRASFTAIQIGRDIRTPALSIRSWYHLASV